MFGSMSQLQSGLLFSVVTLGLACCYGDWINTSERPVQSTQESKRTRTQVGEKRVDTNVVRFVGEVLSGTEYGKDRIAVRWTKGPRLSTFGPSDQHPNAIIKVVRNLNLALPDGYKIELLEPNDESATLQVWFMPYEDLPEFSEERKLHYREPNLGYFYINWNARFEIINATVLIAEDKMKGDLLRHYLLEEITQSLGLGGDSDRFSESVFYEDPSKGEYGTAVRLSKLDRKLIDFHYTHVAPGSHPIELGILMTRHWE